jgi:hypothetical protein
VRHAGREATRIRAPRRADRRGLRYALVNTKPTTLAGILALCRYIEPLFGETDQPDLPEYIDYDDDTQAYIPEAFAYVIGRAIEELMKAPAGKAVQS